MPNALELQLLLNHLQGPPLEDDEEEYENEGDEPPSEDIDEEEEDDAGEFDGIGVQCNAWVWTLNLPILSFVLPASSPPCVPPILSLFLANAPVITSFVAVLPSHSSGA